MFVGSPVSAFSVLLSLKDVFVMCNVVQLVY